VVRSCEFVGYNASASQVEVQVKTAGVPKTIEARWLIGCDGMHSTVREQSDVAFTGAAYEQSFVLADVHMHWPLSRDEVTLFFSPDGLVVVLVQHAITGFARDRLEIRPGLSNLRKIMSRLAPNFILRQLGKPADRMLAQ
jgi:2-polyprenyl-6-methoxyphenol hydroxylase-like FAD-dependent oxidoreductase